MGASGDSFRSPQPADAASAADRADRTAFSPFGTVNGSARAEERPAGNTGYGEYQKSREFLFGGTPAEEIKKRQGVILTDHLESEMKKIIKPERVFLNEIV